MFATIVERTPPRRTCYNTLNRGVEPMRYAVNGSTKTAFAQTLHKVSILVARVSNATPCVPFSGVSVFSFSVVAFKFECMF